MATTMVATAVPKLCTSSTDRRRLYPAKRSTMSFPKFIMENPVALSTTRELELPPAHASNPQNEEDASTANSKNTGFTLAEDLSYLLILGAGSILGAAAIKYGSIFFPDITRPNISQALLMIFTPVIAAVFLLLKQSRTEKRSD